jgi:hypothetical protein
MGIVIYQDKSIISRSLEAWIRGQAWQLRLS